MAITSYILTFALGIIAGLCLSALLASSRHNIDETILDTPDNVE